MRAQLPGRAVQNRVHELVSVGRAESLGEIHRLGERNAIRQFGMRLELVQTQPQHRVLDRIVARRAASVLCVSPDLEERMRAAGARRVAHAPVPAYSIPVPTLRTAGAAAPDSPGERPLGSVPETTLQV